eukprot:g43781.t1
MLSHYLRRVVAIILEIKTCEPHISGKEIIGKDSQGQDLYAFRSNRQHGFVRERLCLTNLIEFFEGVLKIIDDGKVVDVVYTDFSKAFDKSLMTCWYK